MFSSSAVRGFFCLAFFVLAMPFAAHADESNAARFASRYPKGSITSADIAERALEEADKARAGSDAKFSADERECYAKFFVTSCMDTAKERHRIELAEIRQVELEASAFKRRARVQERDQAMKEREAKQAAEPPVTDDRAQRHEDKMKLLQEQNAKEEQQRRKNIAAFEQKQRDVEQRQRDAEQRQQEAEQRLREVEQKKAESEPQTNGAKAAK